MVERVIGEVAESDQASL